MSDTPATLDAETVAHLRSWEGRSETQRELIHAAPLRGLHATLDGEGPAPVDGDIVPPLGRWLYFQPQAPQAQIAEDGHPHKGGFLPPVPLPRRMWAGGRLNWQVDNPLRVGQTAELTSTVQSVQHKAGRSGELVFVVVRHEVRNDAGLCLSEEQDIVYRHMPAAGQAPAAGQPAPEGAVWTREITPTPAWLFRYSALTFNAHRIHYDRPYATQAEGYPGLVVHGPLIATLLVDLVQRQQPDATVAAFAFKAVRPTFDLQPFSVCARPEGDGRVAVWGQDHDGCLTMQGDVTLI